ncbi:hypothetical protein LB503_011261 [Fusarium chuoi]|nr:hypothetical protein LB503_011261 [Fusarium chuoi]
MIEPPPDVKYEGDESQISRSATIDAFSYQDIFLVLLTLASNMGEDFRTEDTSVMEIIYHLVKQVDIEKLFMNEQQLRVVHVEGIQPQRPNSPQPIRYHDLGEARRRQDVITFGPRCAG